MKHRDGAEFESDLEEVWRLVERLQDEVVVLRQRVRELETSRV